MKCWNCLHINAEKAHRCSACDQPLKPNPAQTVSSRRNIDYLLHEIRAWNFLDEEARHRVQTVYGARQIRLDQANDRSAAWPESDWDSLPTATKPNSAQTLSLEGLQGLTAAKKSPTPVPEAPLSSPLPSTAQSIEADLESEKSAPEAYPSKQTTQALSAADILSPEQPSTPNYLETLVGEADIRWFHSLGAILVVAAVIGWLRASWDSYGKALTGFLIALSPLALHFLASRLKKSVPLSARLLSILANILTAPALLALDIFGALPAWVPSDHYWTFSMLVSAAILGWQAHSTHEKTPLYLGAVCCVMAGLSQGALATAALSLALGFFLARESPDADPEWRERLQRVSFGSGTFGAFATLTTFDTAHHPAVPLVAFTASLLFMSLPTLIGQPPKNESARLSIQATLVVIGSVLMRSSLEMSPGGVALYLLFAAALFLQTKPDSPLSKTAVQLASGVGLLALAIGFFSNFEAVLRTQQTLSEASLRFLFAGVGTAFFVHTSRKRQQADESQMLFLTALLCLLGGWIHLFLHFAIRNGVHSVLDFVPLLASLPLFEGLLIVGSRALREVEVKTVWSLSFALFLASFGLTLILQVSGALHSSLATQYWPAILLLHTLLALAWERKWLAPGPTEESQDTRILGLFLPRLVVAGAALSFYGAHFLPSQVSLVAILSLLAIAVYLLRSHYQEAAWEGAWIAIGFTLVIFQQDSWLLATGIASALLAHALPSRKPVSLALSCIFSTITLAFGAANLSLFAVYLPALAFALAAALPARGEKPWKDIGKARFGFDILLCAAIIAGQTPPPGNPFNLFYCLALTAMAAGLYIVHSRAVFNRVVSRSTSLAVIATVFAWSLYQTTLETGALMVIAGLFTMKFVDHQHKLEIANGVFLMGLGQIASETHFMLDPSVLALGVLGVELSTLFSSRPSPQKSNLALLLLAFTQHAPSLWPEATASCFIGATLVVAMRAIQQDHTAIAGISSALFLFKLDSLPLADWIGLKYRLIPTALVLILGGLWKWRSEKSWPKPALQLGLGLLVAPAFLQFAGGIDKTENFVWMLSAGCLYLGIHFIVPEGLRRLFRQAGGCTLGAWAIASLTRAALSLPWQAATLVIGIVLVAIGVVVEKRRRSSDPAAEKSEEL